MGSLAQSVEQLAFNQLVPRSSRGRPTKYRYTFIAGIAQLVEHNLAKVGVASSSLVSRSMAGWQSGYAADCKSVDAGSIPTPASSYLFFSESRFLLFPQPGW